MQHNVFSEKKAGLSYHKVYVQTLTDKKEKYNDLVLTAFQWRLILFKNPVDLIRDHFAEVLISLQATIEFLARTVFVKKTLATKCIQSLVFWMTNTFEVITQTSL